MNEITIVVKSRNEAKPGMDQAGSDASKLETRAKALGEEFSRTSQATDDFGRRLAGSGTFTDFLTGKISGLRQETRKLGEELNRTGDTSLLGKIFDNNTALKDIEKLKGELAKAIGDAGRTGGKEMAKNISASVQGAASTPGLGPILVGILVGAAVVASPMMGAAISGGLLAGVGLAGIGLGIVGQIKNPAVHQALAGLGHDLEGELAEATEPLRGPLIGSIHTVGDALHRALAGIDFKSLAGELPELSGGLAGLIDKMGPGLSEAFKESLPALHELSIDLPAVGQALGNFFHELAASKGSVEGLRTLLALLVGFIDVTGHVVGGLSNAYDWVLRFGDGASAAGSKWADFLALINPAAKPFAAVADEAHAVWHELLAGNGSVEMYGRSLTAVGDAANLSADDLKNLSKEINQTAITQDTLAGQMTAKLFNGIMGIDQATLHWHESLTSLSDTLGKNGLAIDRHTHLLADNTKNAEENRGAILAAVTANMQQYQAFVSAGGSAQEATFQYDRNTAALEKQLRQAGYTSAQVNDLIGRYRSVPDVVNSRLIFEGLTESIDRLDELLRKLAGLPTSKEVRINVTAALGGSAAAGAVAGIAVGHHAAGGIASGLTWVGEEGRELVKLPQGSQVYPHGQSEQMAVNAAAQQPTRGDGAAVFLGPGLDSVFATYLQRLIATGQIKIS